MFREQVIKAMSVQEYGPKPLIQGVEVVELQRHNDEGGALTELLRLSSGQAADPSGFEVRQINYSTMDPGNIKAFHVHPQQTDLWFVPPEDKILLILVDLRKGSPTENVKMRLVLGDGNSQLVRIPPGVAHGARNLRSRPARVIYFMDRHFDPRPSGTQEYRLPWDFFGADIWEVAKG